MHGWPASLSFFSDSSTSCFVVSSWNPVVVLCGMVQCSLSIHFVCCLCLPAMSAPSPWWKSSRLCFRFCLLRLPSFFCCGAHSSESNTDMFQHHFVRSVHHRFHLLHCACLKMFCITFSIFSCDLFEALFISFCIIPATFLSDLVGHIQFPFWWSVTSPSFTSSIPLISLYGSDGRHFTPRYSSVPVVFIISSSLVPHCNRRFMSILVPYLCCVLWFSSRLSGLFFDSGDTAVFGSSFSFPPHICFLALVVALHTVFFSADRFHVARSCLHCDPCSSRHQWPSNSRRHRGWRGTPLTRLAHILPSSGLMSFWSLFSCGSYDFVLPELRHVLFSLTSSKLCRSDSAFQKVTLNSSLNYLLAKLILKCRALAIQTRLGWEVTLRLMSQSCTPRSATTCHSLQRSSTTWTQIPSDIKCCLRGSTHLRWAWHFVQQRPAKEYQSVEAHVAIW